MQFAGVSRPLSCILHGRSLHSNSGANVVLPSLKSRPSAMKRVVRLVRSDWRRTLRMHVNIETLWRTATEQCELVSLGLRGCRLRLWIKGALVVDESVSSWADALKRAAELRIEWPR